MKPNDYIAFHIGAHAQIIIDGAVYQENTPITYSVLFDVIQQKAEYGREVIVKPILRPLSDITVEELKECRRVSGTTRSHSSKIIRYTGEHPEEYVKNWRCFEPQVMVYLLKQFDLFGLIPAGLAIDKTKL